MTTPRSVEEPPSHSEKARQAAMVFDRLAKRYDMMFRLTSLGMGGRWRKQAARCAMKDLEGSALDVAAGTGDLALALAKQPGATSVVALDILPSMLEIAAAKSARRADAAAPIELIVGDALALPFDDGEFVSVASAFGLRNVADPEQALAEMTRVTRPGGRVVTLEAMPNRRGPLRPLAQLYMRRCVPLMAALLTATFSEYSYFPQSLDQFLTPNGLTELYRKAGLTNVGSRSMAMGAAHLHWGEKPSMARSI